MVFSRFCCVALDENALFKSSGIICQSLLLSLLLDELPSDRRDSEGFLSIKVISVSSCNATDLKLSLVSLK